MIQIGFFIRIQIHKCKEKVKVEKKALVYRYRKTFSISLYTAALLLDRWRKSQHVFPWKISTEPEIYYFKFNAISRENTRVFVPFYTGAFSSKTTHTELDHKEVTSFCTLGWFGFGWGFLVCFSLGYQRNH